MRILMHIDIPHEPFNTMAKNGTIGAKIKKILEAIKPEAIYFTEEHGMRGAVMAVELADPSKIPSLAEPWFLTFNADVKMRMAMTPDDLQRAGLDEIAKKWG